MVSGPNPYIKKLRKSIVKNSKNIASMSNEQVNKLSAAEKYDLLVGDKDFSLTKNILKTIENNNDRWGHSIKFTSEDRKALASYFTATSVTDKEPIFFGRRCNTKKPKQNGDTKVVLELNSFSRDKTECSDIAAHDFQNILVNKLGREKQAFIADVDYNSPINNHPIAGYTIDFVSRR